MLKILDLNVVAQFLLVLLSLQDCQLGTMGEQLGVQVWYLLVFCLKQLTQHIFITFKFIDISDMFLGNLNPFSLKNNNLLLQVLCHYLELLLYADMLANVRFVDLYLMLHQRQVLLRTKWSVACWGRVYTQKLRWLWLLIDQSYLHLWGFLVVFGAALAGDQALSYYWLVGDVSKGEMGHVFLLLHTQKDFNRVTYIRNQVKSAYLK